LSDYVIKKAVRNSQKKEKEPEEDRGDFLFHTITLVWLSSRTVLLKLVGGFHEGEVKGTTVRWRDDPSGDLSSSKRAGRGDRTEIGGGLQNEHNGTKFHISHLNLLKEKRGR